MLHTRLHLSITVYQKDKRAKRENLPKSNALSEIGEERKVSYEGRTESLEQLFFACELGTADEGECGGRWNQLLCYP